MQLTIRIVKAGFLIFGFAFATSITTNAQQKPASQRPPVRSATVPSSSGKELKNAVTVTGVITDAATNKPLAGVGITYKDVSAAITDSTGKFSLKVPNYNVAISVAINGYQNKEIALKGRQTVSSGLYE